MVWKKVINENRKELLTAIKDAYRNSLEAGLMPADCYYQVEISHEGNISIYFGNGGGSEQVRNGKAKLVFLAKLRRWEDGSLLPEDFQYFDYLDENDKKAIKKIMDENDIDSEEAIRIYDENLINLINTQFKYETIKAKCEKFSPEKVLEEYLLILEN